MQNCSCIFLSFLNKLHHALFRNPPPVPNAESLNLPGMQQSQHRILPNLQQFTALTEGHNFGNISVHIKSLLEKYSLYQCSSVFVRPHRFAYLHTLHLYIIPPAPNQINIIRRNPT